jgi:PPM family protein phosphatase
MGYAAEDASKEILAFGLSDTGKKRSHNEDAYLVDDEYRVYVVADGMGGHVGGEVASSLAVKTIYEDVKRRRREIVELERATPPNEHPAMRVLQEAVKHACSTIYHKGQVEPELNGMGTTVTGLTFVDDVALLAHVGDSRAYLIRGNRIDQLSNDHTWVNEQVKAGLIDEAQAKRSPLRHYIARSVGYEADVDVDARAIAVKEGDIYVLASDGLTNLISKDEITKVVRQGFLREAPRRLVELANARGGDDNITVIVLYVNGRD